MIYLWYSQRAPTRPTPRGASEEARIKRAENWSKYLGFHWKWPGKRGENHRKPMGIWILKTWWNEFLAKFEINGNRCFFGGFSGDIIVDMEKKLLVGTKFQVQGEIQDHRRETYQDSWGATTITDQKRMVSIPIRSMYGIYGNIYHQYTPNVSIYIYTIHGSYGICLTPVWKIFGCLHHMPLLTLQGEDEWHLQISLGTTTTQIATGRWKQSRIQIKATPL